MTMHSSGRRTAFLVAAGWLALACGSKGEGWPIPVPEVGATLDGRMRARIDAAVAAVHAAPGADGVWLALGMTYEANELFALAVECYARALELAPAAKTWHRLACAEAARGDAAAAAAAMRRSLELEPTYASSHWRLGSYLFELGEFDAALAEFEAVTRLDPEHLGGPIGAARVHLQRGAPERAVALLEPVQRARPEDRTLARLLHAAYLQAGRAAEAARIDPSPRGRAPNYGRDPWQREFREHWERPRMEQALELLQGGQAARAIELLEPFTAEVPEDKNASAYLAQAYLEAGRLDEARATAMEALADEPDNLLVLRALARVEERRGAREAALATQTRIVTIDPNDAPTWRAKARLESELGRRVEALASLRHAFGLDQREPEVLLEIAALELSLEQVDAAIASFERARAAGVARPELVLGLARAYARAGRVSEAIALVEGARDLGRAGEVLLGELRARVDGAPR